MSAALDSNLHENPVVPAADAAPPRLDLPQVSSAEIARLAADIEQTGCGVLPNYVAPETIAQLQHFVEQRVAAAGSQYVGLVGKAAFQGTLLDAIAEAPEFLSLMHRLYTAGTGQNPPEQTLYQVLRCIRGRTGEVHSFYFHFDSYVVTALLPIIIPEREQAGHLVMMPNLRRIRRSYLHNLLDKLLLDNKYAQRLLRRPAMAHRLGFKQIKIVQGNLYFFWGYRTLHANEACDPDCTRATALFHFGDPHAQSRLRARLGKAEFRAAAK